MASKGWQFRAGNWHIVHLAWCVGQLFLPCLSCLKPQLPGSCFTDATLPSCIHTPDSKLFFFNAILEVTVYLLWYTPYTVLPHFPPTDFLCLHVSFTSPPSLYLFSPVSSTLPRDSMTLEGWSNLSVLFQDAILKSTWFHRFCRLYYLQLQSLFRMVNFGFTRAPHLPPAKHAHTHMLIPNSNYGFGISPSPLVLLVTHMQTSSANRVWQRVTVSHSPTRFTDFPLTPWSSTVGPPHHRIPIKIFRLDQK